MVASEAPSATLTPPSVAVRLSVPTYASIAGHAGIVNGFVKLPANVVSVIAIAPETSETPVVVPTA